MTLPRQGYFDDREHAAERLLEPLLAYRGQHPLVLAIPRGGVPIGRLLADRLGQLRDRPLLARQEVPAGRVARPSVALQIRGLLRRS